MAGAELGAIQLSLFLAGTIPDEVAFKLHFVAGAKSGAIQPSLLVAGAIFDEVAVKLHIQFSWQAQFLVQFNGPLSWQAQYLVKFAYRAILCSAEQCFVVGSSNL